MERIKKRTQPGVLYQLEQLNTLLQSSPEINEQLISSTLVMCETIHMLLCKALQLRIVLPGMGYVLRKPIMQFKGHLTWLRDKSSAPTRQQFSLVSLSAAIVNFNIEINLSCTDIMNRRPTKLFWQIGNYSKIELK